MVIARTYEDSMPEAFELKDGPEFIERPAAQVLDHLNWLFNYITDRAKQRSALTRFRLEEYAGSLLTGQAGGGRLR